jgi:NarL family two-component system response regulator YdfI
LIRVVIVAPAIAIRAGLAALIGDDPQMEVVAEAANLLEVDKHQSDANVVIWAPGSSAGEEHVVMDLQTTRIEETIALLVIHDDPSLMEALTQLKVRAWGFLGTEFTQVELLTSIQGLNEGLVVTDPIWVKRAFTHRTGSEQANDGLIEPLTGREIEILQLLAYGLTNKQIAARLKISAHTVKFHISMIFNKMGTTNRVETVNLALKKGLIVL